MIGRVAAGGVFNNRDWPVASAVAIIMLLLLMVPRHGSANISKKCQGSTDE